MVMKEECNPDYITKIVSNILPEVIKEEAQLLKYIAVLNMFMEDFGMPVSCCDGFMNANLITRTRKGYNTKICSMGKPALECDLSASHPDNDIHKAGSYESNEIGQSRTCS